MSMSTAESMSTAAEGAAAAESAAASALDNDEGDEQLLAAAKKLSLGPGHAITTFSFLQSFATSQKCSLKSTRSRCFPDATPSAATSLTCLTVRPPWHLTLSLPQPSHDPPGPRLWYRVNGSLEGTRPTKYETKMKPRKKYKNGEKTVSFRGFSVCKKRRAGHKWNGFSHLSAVSPLKKVVKASLSSRSKQALGNALLSRTESPTFFVEAWSDPSSLSSFPW